MWKNPSILRQWFQPPSGPSPSGLFPISVQMVRRSPGGQGTTHTATIFVEREVAEGVPPPYADSGSAENAPFPYVNQGASTPRGNQRQVEGATLACTERGNSQGASSFYMDRGLAEGPPSTPDRNRPVLRGVVSQLQVGDADKVDGHSMSTFVPSPRSSVRIFTSLVA